MKQFSRTLDNLIDIIDEQKRDIQRLASLLINLLKEDRGMTRTCDVIRTDSDLLDHLQEYDIDYVVFITPGQFVTSMDREEIDRLSEAGELVATIARNWESDTIAIPVP